MFPIKPSSSVSRGLAAVAGRVAAGAKRARERAGLLPPLASTRQVASEATQKGLAGIAKIVSEGDRAAQIELKHRKGYFR